MPLKALSINMISVDHLVEKWVGFHKNSKEAQIALDKQVSKYNKQFLIVKASKEIMEKKSHDSKTLVDKDTNELIFPYKFTIVKALRDK